MIDVSTLGTVRLIELRRPQRRNALDTGTCRDLIAAISSADDDGARVVVLTGEGTSFCAGADLSGDEFANEFPMTVIELMKTIQAVPVPVVAAVNGPAIGAGMQLTLAADLRICDVGARFAIPAARLGLAVDAWTLRRAATLVGASRARGLLLAAQELSYEDAVTCGFANRTGDRAAALAWAAEIAELAPLPLRYFKDVFNDDGTQAEPTPSQQAGLIAAWSSTDVSEGRRAHAEKRPPRFTGALRT